MLAVEAPDLGAGHYLARQTQREARQLAVGRHEPEPAERRAAHRRLAAHDQQPLSVGTPAGIQEPFARLERRPPTGAGRCVSGWCQPHDTVGVVHAGPCRGWAGVAAQVRQEATVRGKRQPRAGDVGEQRLQHARSWLQAPCLQLRTGWDSDRQRYLAIVQQAHVDQRGTGQRRPQAHQAGLATPQHGVERRAFARYPQAVLAVQAARRLEQQRVRTGLNRQLSRRTAMLASVKPDRGARRSRRERQRHRRCGRRAGLGAAHVRQQPHDPDRQREDQPGYPCASHTQNVPQLFLARRLEYDGEWELHGHLR